MADFIISNSSKSNKFVPEGTVFPFDAAIHLLTPIPTDEQQEKIKAFREALEKHPQAELYRENLEWVDDKQLQRFLIARNYNLQASLDMIVHALQWRSKRRPHEIDSKEGWEAKISKEGETGKIYVPGYDKWKRPVVVMDNGAQNTSNLDDQMNFLAWNLEFCTRLMPSTVDKYCAFVHLETFSFFAMPSMAASKETILMLGTTFPERLGHCIAYRPPTIFRMFWDAVKGFLDPKTRSKIIFINGDITDGSENDKLLRNIIGDDWKELTGAEQPYIDKRCSPGYSHEKYWPTVIERLDILKSPSSSAKLPSFDGANSPKSNVDLIDPETQALINEMEQQFHVLETSS
eukprot:gene6529-7202_t